MGAETSPAEPEFFCVVNQTTFWQLCNGWFSPNLVTKHTKVSRRGIRKDILENFHFLGVMAFAPKSEIESQSQAHHSEQATGHRMHCREILFTPRCSARAREFRISVNFFLRSCRASKLPSFWILAYFPHAKPLTRTFPWPAYSPGLKPDIGSESRFLPTPPAFDAPLGGFSLEYCHAVWYKKTRMVWLTDSEKILKIYLFVLTQCTNVTDTETLHDG